MISRTVFDLANLIANQNEKKSSGWLIKVCKEALPY